MKKRIFSLLIAAVMLISLTPSALAAPAGQAMEADILYTLGLFKGGTNGYELDRTVTRAEAATMIVRLSGGEAIAQSHEYETPFTDLADWSRPYIGYAYAQSFVRGVSDTRFGGGETARAADYMTMLLRLMGYDDAAGDFSYDTALLTARRLGLTTLSDGAALTRGGMVAASLRALTTPGKDGVSLGDRLLAAGVLDAAVYNAVGLGDTNELTAREIADRYSNAVFHIVTYSSQKAFDMKMPFSSASGFFITPDGVAVTCCHSITGATHATATLLSGETYDIERVLYYDHEVDVAVIKVSPTSADGVRTAAFPALSCASSDSLRVGDIVYSIGCPLNMSNSLGDGIVSQLFRDVVGYAMPMIQNTAPISQGSSGGALLNVYGQVVGVTAAHYTYGNDMYLSIPIEAVTSADHSGEGITFEQMNKEIAEKETE